MIGNYFFSSSGAAAYEIEQSLRFDGGAYLQRTPASAGSRTTFTWSGWVKFADHEHDLQFFSAGSAFANYDLFRFSNNVGTYKNKLEFYSNVNAAYQRSNAQYRDPGAWYHVVGVLDTNNATAGDRLRIYVNGERIDSWQGTISLTSGRTMNYFNTANQHRIGLRAHSTSSYPAQWAISYYSEVHFIDGTAVDPEGNFGEFDDNGVWRPIAYSGSYGTNGFYLKFDPSATNGIGHDHSGNGNNWTASGFTTSGTGTDVMSDTPTNNFCTMNPLWQPQPSAGNPTLSEGNLKAVHSSSGSNAAWGTFGMSAGKWYWEAEASSLGSGTYGLGIVGTNEDRSKVGVASPFNAIYVWVQPNGGVYTDVLGGAPNSSFGAGYTTGDVMGFAYDADGATLDIYKNGSSYGSQISISSKSDTVVPASMSSNNADTWVWNFGQRAYEYTPPSGYKALSTANLPAPDVADGSDYFNTVLWTGNGSSSSRTISGVGFQPDFTWIKGRSYNGSGNRLMDAVRGAGQMIQTNSQNPEFDDSANVPSFASDGFNLTTNGTSYNASSQTYVAWNWLANGSGSSNTAGSITSTVSVNQTAGFSIVTYSGSTQNDTVGHGLGVAPSLIIFKRRNNTTSWPVYHSAIGPSNFVQLNELSASSSSGTSFGSTPTAPTNTVFSVGNNGGTNYGTMVAYCFAEVEGYSKFGSYQANNSSDGPFVYCGFKPALVLLRSYNGSSNRDWLLYDSTRSTYNNERGALVPNTTLPESSRDDSVYRAIDFVSNGFKLRTSGTPNMNANGESYIFAAFAENPFGGSGVSPATAR